jgi:hypothetical protein
VRDNSIPVNPKDVAFLARYDHVVAIVARGPSMVERNPVVVRCEAPRERRKQRGGMWWIIIDPEDQIAFYGENVARGEPGQSGRRWSNSHVFFPAGTKPRKRRVHRDNPEAGDLIDVLGAVFAHEQKIRPSGHARGKGDTNRGGTSHGKGSWMGGGELGVKHSRER